MRNRSNCSPPSGNQIRQQNGMPDLAGRPLGRRKGLLREAWHWVDSKIYVYQVTFGLYMLDWWERILFNVLVLLLLWFVAYSGSDFVVRCFERLSKVFRDWPAAGGLLWA